MTISELVGTTVLGMPLVAWGGLLTLLMLATTGTYGFLLYKGKIRAPISNHFKLGLITVAIALIHGFAAFAWIMGF